MELKFIGQGLDAESDVTAGNFIIDSLESKNYSSFNAFVAFVSMSGIKNIIDQMNDFKKAGGEIKLYLGVNLNATSKEALETLLEHGIESYVIYSPNNIIYHPKIYTFKGDETTKAIIGSSNLTESGLFQNMEASVCIDFENDDENGNEFLADIYDHFNSIVNKMHPSCQLLTQEVLKILIESNIVLPEAANRAKTNKIKKEFGQKGIKVNKKLHELFAKIKAKRPPKGFRKKATKKELIVEKETKNINVVDETIELAAGSLWVETRSMTGGSRNILDLSKTGKLNGQDKFGSVEYFGVEAFDYNQEKKVNIIFSGSIYYRNDIFYPSGAKKNGTWRIRLNGETENGEKLTTLSKPSLGKNGGFQNKILLFTKIDDTNFKLEILEKDEMQRLIENSSEWAKSGRSNGRAYGIIAE